jgi:phage gpG-like protein
MSTIHNPDKYFAQLGVKVEKAVMHDAPLIIGNELVKAFKQNFQDEAFFGKKWQDVKRRTNPPKGKEGLADARRKILTGRTGNLGRSIRKEVRDGSVRIYSDLPYSAAHNEGTTTAGRGRHTVIPQRQFIGRSKEVDDIVRAAIEKAMRRAIEP